MKVKKVFAAILAAALLAVSSASVSAVDLSVPAKDVITVEKIDFNNPDFIRGMDVSSVISLENAGVAFKSESGSSRIFLKSFPTTA